MNPPELPTSETTPPKPPPYARTLLRAAALFGFDGLIGGQGFMCIFVLVLGVPVLLIRAALARKDAPLLKRRLASVGIYAGAALAAIGVVRLDQAGAEKRAEQVIAACEEFKKAEGDYPKTLAELTPKFLPAIPHARHVGMAKEFMYFVLGTNDFRGEAIHTLTYVVTPPFGRSTYNFEAKRWGFLD